MGLIFFWDNHNIKGIANFIQLVSYYDDSIRGVQNICPNSTLSTAIDVKSMDSNNYVIEQAEK